MELYIEKEFLDNFYLEFDEKLASIGQQIIASILKEYGEIDWYINTPIESSADLDTLIKNNPFFAYRASYSPPLPVESIKDHFLEFSNCSQTIIITENEEEWFGEAELKGALCLATSSYQERIKSILKECHLKVDLSIGFNNWDLFRFQESLPFNKIIINDNYILTDSNNQRIDKNLIPMVKTLMGENRTKEVPIYIFTKELKPEGPGTSCQIKDALEKKHRRLNSSFANYKLNFKVINNNLLGGQSVLHDRVMLSNFLMVDCGKGFNLLPHSASNSQIIVESIFDKYTYKRMKNHNKIHQDYLNNLKTLKNINFTIYPS